MAQHQDDEQHATDVGERYRAATHEAQRKSSELSAKTVTKTALERLERNVRGVIERRSFLD